jgi:hypothetical protein
MTLVSDTPRPEDAPAASPWEERQHRFEQQQAAFVLKVAASQQDRLALRKERASLEQERRQFEQERLALWNDLQEQWQARGDGEQHLSQMRARMQMRQRFADTLTDEQQRFSLRVQAYQERIAALHEQRTLARELSDPAQRLAAYRQIQDS